MIQVPELNPVRDYSNIRKDALEPFLRAAAGTNEGIDKRSREFREHAVRVLGPEVFQKDRAALLDALKDEARSWGLSFHTNPDQVLDYAAANPIVLRLPLSKLLNVPASHNTVSGMVADAIDSVVVRIVWNSTAKDIEQALQRAAGVGGMDKPVFHALNPVEFRMLKKWPFEGLNYHTFQYLDKVISDWGKSVPNLGRLVPDELHSFMISNAPRTQDLQPDEKLKLLKKSSLLALSKIDPLLKKMNPARNNVGDVVSAALDTAIHENSFKWLEEVGRSIDWKDRFSKELQQGDTPSDSGPSQDDVGTKDTSNKPATDPNATQVGKKPPRANTPTQVLK